MVDRRTRQDRRRENRRVVAGRILWNRPGRRVNYIGWLSDVSNSSASFITAQSCRPAVGEHVELMGNNNKSRQCRVTRTAAYDARLSLVACEQAS